MTEKMKPSGAAWIGEIPVGWNTKRIKYLASLKGRIGWQGLTSNEYTEEGPYLITGIDFLNGGIDWENCVHITEARWAEAPEIHINNGDLLITKDGTVGKVAIVNGLHGKASLNSGVLLIRTLPGFDKRFLYWVIQSEEFWRWFRLKNAGNSTIIHLYQGDFAEFSYAFPQFAEQQAIADFLDAQCAKIDNIIVDIEKQIELLQQHKKSLITEMVTKGLDRSVTMKDSGIEWIGKIPAHWDIIRIKDISSLQTGTTPPGNEGVNYDNNGIQWYTPSDFIEGSIELTTSEKYIDLDTVIMDGIKPYPAESVLFVGIASIGKIGYCKECSYSNQQITAIKPCLWCDGEFMAYCLLAGIDQIKDNALFTTVPIINNAYLGTVKICLPPKEEQQAICKLLNDTCKKIDDIVQCKKAQLDTMQQHKKSLIYEYVTGKKRVTEVN